MSSAAVLKIEMIVVTGGRHEPRIQSGLRDFLLVCLVAFAGIAVSLLAPAGWSVASDHLLGGAESRADAGLVS
jgi:hypothetical protein